MRNQSGIVVIAVLIGVMAATVFGQASKPATASAAADEAAVIVNGRPIMESQIDDVIGNGRQMSKEQLAEMRQRFKANMPRLIDYLIDNELVAQAAKKADVTVSDKELDDDINQQLNDFLKSKNQDREEYGKQLKEQTGKSLDEFLKERSRTAGFKAAALQSKLVREKFAKDIKVADEDVKSYYDQNKESKYTQQEQVRASHILLATKDAKTDEAKAAQHKKAEEVLAEVKKPGSDFAALAQKYSDCPSKTRGGDLNFFPRKGMMVEPFAEAAFNQKVGEVSGIVETQFGYHIIKTTDRKPGKTSSFDEVKDQIRREREAEKIQAASLKMKEELRKDAKIVYPPGKELATRPASQPSFPRNPGMSPMIRPGGTRPAGGSSMNAPAGGSIKVLPPSPKKDAAK
jgi:peptidyl-prolyl cis-trans isomerase C